MQIPCFFASLPWDALFLAHQRPLSKTEGYPPPPEASEPKSSRPRPPLFIYYLLSGPGLGASVGFQGWDDKSRLSASLGPILQGTMGDI